MILVETADLLQILLFTIRMIIESGAQDKQRIASAYRDPRSLATSIDFGNDSVRPRIVACLVRFNTYKNSGNVAAAGWMLAAIKEHVRERYLYGWRKLQDIVDAAIYETLFV